MGDMNAVEIDVWADVVCPWCYLGKRRLELAIAESAHPAEVTVTYHAFELDPSAPRGSGERVLPWLAQRYGVDLEGAREMAERLFTVRRYIVMCDRVHALKVRALSAILLRREFKVRSVPRQVPLKITLFEPVSLVAEVVAAVVPLFRRPLRRMAMRFKGLSEPSPRSAQREVA